MPSITDRFFEAFDDLVFTKKLSGRKFCAAMDIDRRNFYKKAKDHSLGYLNPDWLAYLVKEYGVSARWLLTGDGGMFGK